MKISTIGTNETRSFAAKIGRKIKFDRNQIVEKIIRFVMNLKIEDVKRDIESEKERSKLCHRELDKIVRPQTISA